MLGPDADAIADFLEDTSNAQQPKTFVVRTETPVGYTQINEYTVVAVDAEEALDKVCLREYEEVDTYIRDCDPEYGEEQTTDVEEV